MILSHTATSCLDMIYYRAIWIHFGPNFRFVSRCSQTTHLCCSPELPMSSSSHSHYSFDIYRNRDRKKYGRTLVDPKSLKLFTHYVRRSSKTLSEMGCVGDTFPQPCSNLPDGPLFVCGKYNKWLVPSD